MLILTPKIKRFQVFDLNLNKWLEQFTFISIAGHYNKYHDTHILSFFEKGILISTDGQLLEIKSDSAYVQQDINALAQTPQKRPYHYQFDLPLNEQQRPLFEECGRIMGVRLPRPFFTLKTFLRDNALRETVTIDVSRRTYIQEALTLTVDDVREHGIFMSFKEDNHKRSFDLFEKEVDALVAPLSVKSMSTNYLTQIFQSSLQASQVKINAL